MEGVYQASVMQGMFQNSTCEKHVCVKRVWEINMLFHTRQTKGLNRHTALSSVSNTNVCYNLLQYPCVVVRSSHMTTAAPVSLTLTQVGLAVRGEMESMQLTRCRGDPGQTHALFLTLQSCPSISQLLISMCAGQVWGSR
jgi:hypothetical protein